MLYIIIGLAGAAGALLRFSLGIWTDSLLNTPFPFATLLCNVAGSFMLGWLYAAPFSKLKLPPYVKQAVGVGLIGSFTTFSTFSAETMFMLQERQWLAVLAYLLLSFVGGLFSAWQGWQLGSFAKKAEGSEGG